MNYFKRIFIVHLKAAEVWSWLLPNLRPSAFCQVPVVPGAEFPGENNQIQTLKLSICKYKARSIDNVLMSGTYLSNHLFYVTQFSFALCVLSCQGAKLNFFVQLCGPAE